VARAPVAAPADLWGSDAAEEWRRALERYEETVARQGVEALPELDRWVRVELPQLLASREAAHVTLDELVRVTRWKMARGVWRARNLALVQGNDPETVVEVSRNALAAVSDPRAPITTLTRLDGVGPATASAVVAAVAPEVYPFFDELVAEQVPALGKVAFTLPYYLRYAEAIRERAARLGRGWSAVAVERALWSNAGGKAGVGGRG
jgi:hypothetical protein